MTVTDLRDARSQRRVPPHDLQAESSLLGAMMLSKNAVDVACERLQSADFYKPANGHIFEAITTLAGSGEPTDAVAVSGELDRVGLLAGVGGGAYLFELLNNPGVSSSATRYAATIEDCAVLRRLIATGGEVAELGYEGRGDVRATLDHAEKLIYDVAQRRARDTSTHFDGALEQFIDNLEARFERGDAITGVPTGFVDLDDMLSGLQPGSLYVIGARPSAGKTALALAMITHAVLERRLPTYLFSLEMSQDQIVQRIVSAEARVDSKRVRTGQISDRDWRRVTDSIHRMGGMPLEIDDDPLLSIMELRSKARRYKSQVGDLGLIVVDYLQLMTGRASSESRQVEVAEMSRGLKILARELNVPVIALSQLSRNLEMRADKRPQLSDLRESGSIEQDADVVMFIYRDEIYNRDSPDRGTAEIIVSKHRNGPVGVVRLAFLEHYAKFANMAKGV